MSTLPLQHQEIAELSKLLCLVEALLSSEREANSRKTLRSEQEAREQEEKSQALAEQLSLLQQELDNSQRAKADLEEQMKVCKEETQRVAPYIFNLKSKVFPSNLLSYIHTYITCQRSLFLTSEILQLR